MNKLLEAFKWLNMGVTPIPCKPRSKEPLVKWSRYNNVLPQHSQVAEWFAGDNDYNLSLMTGELLVLDFDLPSSYYAWKLEYPEQAQSYTVNTSRGKHVYFWVDKPTQTIALNGVDVIGMRHLITAPPSVHQSGKHYTVYNDGDILSVEGVTDVINIERESVEKQVKEYRLVEPLPILGNRIMDIVRRKLSILEMLRQFTGPILHTGNGRWFTMRCPHPNHKDNNPSFWADAYLGICGCFKPSCRASQPGNRAMDVFNLYSWLTGLQNGDAIKELAKEVL